MSGQKKNIFARFFGAIWGWIKRHKVLSIVLVLLTALIVYIVVMVNKAKDILQNNSFDMATVEVRDLTNSISATGKITGLEKKNVNATLSGVKFAEIKVEVGDKVNAGDVIALLDSSDIEENIDIAEKQLNVSDANTAIGVNGAYRSYENAVQSRDRDAEKADINIARAWESYADACNDVNEAANKYNDAVKKREEAENNRNNAANAIANQNAISSSYESQFEAGRNELYDFLVTPSCGFTTSSPEYVELGTYDVGEFAGYNKVATPFNAIPDQTTDPDRYTEYLLYGKVSDFNPGSELSANEAQVINDKVNALKAISSSYLTAVNTPSGNLASAEQVLATMKSAEESAKSMYETACSTADKMYQSYEDMVRTKEDTKRMDESTIATARDSYNTTKNNASVGNLQSKQNIENLEEQVEACTVAAPMSGTVTAVNYKVGDKYDGVNAIVVIEDESSYQVSAEIDEYDISRVQVGQKVKITTNGTGDAELEGVVATIAPHATATVGTTSTAVTYNIKIDILTPNPDLKMDMTAKINIVTDSKAMCKCLPADAIQTDDDGNLYVEIMNENVKVGEDGKMVYDRIYIQKGMESDYYTEVISNELTEGMQVVLPSNYNSGLYDLQWEIG